jgi:hypothetical protein
VIVAIITVVFDMVIAADVKAITAFHSRHRVFF